MIIDMARPRKKDRPESTRERILAASSELFASRGFQAVTLAEIAERVGIRAPSLLYHFGSKGELYEAVVARFYARLATALVGSAAPQSSAPEAAIVFVLERLRALDGPDRDLLVTIILELLHDGRGGATVGAAIGPVIEAVTAHTVTALGLTPEAATRVRPVLGLVMMGAILELDSERIPAPVAALRDAIWGDSADAVEIARVLLGGLR